MTTLNKHRLADWSKAPKWAAHHAVDKDGSGWWYADRADILTGEKQWSIEIGVKASEIKHDLTGIDWRETLETRPNLI